MTDPFSSIDPFATSTTAATGAAPKSGPMTVAVNADFSGFRSEMAQATRIGQQFGTSLASAFDGLIVKGRSLTDVVRNLGQSLSQVALKAAFKPLENAVGTGIGNLFSGGLTGGVDFGFARGGVFQGGVPIPFARGGVIASPITFPMGRGQTGIAGERGAEAIMPLARGPDGRLGIVSAGGGAPMQIHVNIATSDIDSFQRAESQISALLARAVSRGQRNL